MALRAFWLPKVGGGSPWESVLKNKRPGNVKLSGLLFQSDCELFLVLLEITNGVVNLLALIVAVEQKREVVGTEP